MCVDRFAPDRQARTLMATHSVVPGTWLSMAFVNGGGLALRGFRDRIAAGVAGTRVPYAALDGLAARAEPGAGGLVWLPHLQGRVLPPRPHVRGGWVGLTAGHTLGEMYRAILEGVAFEYAVWARMAAVPLHEARVLGGGAASGLWNQIKADALGIDWVPTVRQEAGVLGDALIAAAATGHVTDLAAAAAAWQRTGPPVRPDPDRHRRYQPLIGAYREFGDGTVPLFDGLARATAPPA
jgi:xylulokinase